jgi:hypothetical protein
VIKLCRHGWKLFSRKCVHLLIKSSQVLSCDFFFFLLGGFQLEGRILERGQCKTCIKRSSVVWGDFSDSSLSFQWLVTPPLCLVKSAPLPNALVGLWRRKQSYKGTNINLMVTLTRIVTFFKDWGNGKIEFFSSTIPASPGKDLLGVISLNPLGSKQFCTLSVHVIYSDFHLIISKLLKLM